ncbi:LacI family DNA-binding transcriptional regulator [Thorsellia anophelis]|uniref:Transcriptional regulator, LacI family n=1 Tax=Thorsellia anophelis DSM 18579 TaxID=1123402 RepID=A0A1I0B915_9GAMM|nr:LacI family DNA-binding transcriptional regulator [Thorsellia anophelis]SET03282.1 transcriptional regulator, LacI family [Thorsellia anophelis DSM 18579]
MAKDNSTIIDIAAKAGVTNITVSRAFNKPHLVKKVTREKILAIAKELNYVPNAFAKGLKSNKSQIIGIVASSIYNPFYSTLIKTVSRIAHEQGYQIMIFDSDGKQDVEHQAIKTLLSYQAEGILLSVIRDDKMYKPDYLDMLDEYNIPIVLIDRDIQDKTLSGVFLDNHQIGVDSGIYIAKKQIDRLLIIGGPKDSLITQTRIKGIKHGLGNLKDEIIIDKLFGDYSFIEQKEALFEYLTRKELPNMIVCLNGIIAIGALTICHVLNLQDKILFFSVDHPPNSQAYGQFIPGIYHNSDEIGQIAAEILFDKINVPELVNRPLRKVVKGHLQTNKRFFLKDFLAELS